MDRTDIVTVLRVVTIPGENLHSGSVTKIVDVDAPDGDHGLVIRILSMGLRRRRHSAAERGDQLGRGLTTVPGLGRVVLVVALGSLMSMLDATIINVALRTLSADLSASLTTIQWVITAYLLAMAAVVPITGWLARRLGTRRVYLIALILFTLASAGCGLADSAGELIALRAVQGVSGGLLAVGQMIVVLHAGKAALARAMAAVTLPMVLGPIFGPTIGGLLLVSLGWRWIFFVNVPVGVVAVTLGLRSLPAGATHQGGRLDFSGLILALLGALALTYGLAELGSAGTNPAGLLAGLGAGMVLLTIFVVRSLRSDHPLLDLRLMRNPVFGAAAATTFCIGGLISGGLVLMPLYYQLIRHQDALATGMLLAPQGIGAAFGIWLAGRATDRFGSRTVTAGAMVAAISAIPLIMIGTATSYIVLTSVIVLRAFGIGLAAQPAMTAAFRAIAPQKVNEATPQLLFLQRTGGSVATAGFIAVLHHQLSVASDPTGRAAAFGLTYWWVLGLSLVALLLSLALVLRESNARSSNVEREASLSGS